MAVVFGDAARLVRCWGSSRPESYAWSWLAPGPQLMSRHQPCAIMRRSITPRPVTSG